MDSSQSQGQDRMNCLSRMKDYLQPAATIALALALGCLPFTVPMGVQAIGEEMRIKGIVSVSLVDTCTN